MASSTTSVITHQRRVNLAKITRGEVETIPKITHIAFGSGGVDENGQPIQPLETQTALNNEVARYGQLAAVKTFLNKGKDGDVEFTFQFDDEF